MAKGISGEIVCDCGSARCAICNPPCCKCVNPLLNKGLFAHKKCKTLNHIRRSGEIFYLIKPSGKAITNEEHFTHNIEQLFRHFTGILDREEIEKFSVEVIKKLYGR